jgi:hypothetical protein
VFKGEPLIDVSVKGVRLAISIVAITVLVTRGFQGAQIGSVAIVAVVNAGITTAGNVKANVIN